MSEEVLDMFAENLASAIALLCLLAAVSIPWILALKSRAQVFLLKNNAKVARINITNLVKAYLDRVTNGYPCKIIHLDERATGRDLYQIVGVSNGLMMGQFVLQWDDDILVGFSFEPAGETEWESLAYSPADLFSFLFAVQAFLEEYFQKSK